MTSLMFTGVRRVCLFTVADPLLDSDHTDFESVVKKETLS